MLPGCCWASILCLHNSNAKALGLDNMKDHPSNQACPLALIRPGPSPDIDDAACLDAGCLDPAACLEPAACFEPAACLKPAAGLKPTACLEPAAALQMKAATAQVLQLKAATLQLEDLGKQDQEQGTKGHCCQRSCLHPERVLIHRLAWRK